VVVVHIFVLPKRHVTSQKLAACVDPRFCRRVTLRVTPNNPWLLAHLFQSILTTNRYRHTRASKPSIAVVPWGVFTHYARSIPRIYFCAYIRINLTQNCPRPSKYNVARKEPIPVYRNHHHLHNGSVSHSIRTIRPTMHITLSLTIRYDLGVGHPVAGPSIIV
jgi:hypothetical protein